MNADFVARAQSLLLVIAEVPDTRAAPRETIVEKAYRRIIRARPQFKRWTARRVRTLLTKELQYEPHRIRGLEIADLERTAEPIQRRADAAARGLLDLRARLLASGDVGFHRGHILALDAALAAMGLAVEPELPPEDPDEPRSLER